MQRNYNLPARKPIDRKRTTKFLFRSGKSLSSSGQSPVTSTNIFGAFCFCFFFFLFFFYPCIISERTNFYNRHRKNESPVFQYQQRLLPSRTDKEADNMLQGKFLFFILTHSRSCFSFFFFSFCFFIIFNFDTDGRSVE